MLNPSHKHTHLLHKIDAIVSLQWLDGDSSAVDQLGQINGLGGVHSTQINEILQSAQSQWGVLGTLATEIYNIDK